MSGAKPLARERVENFLDELKKTFHLITTPLFFKVWGGKNEPMYLSKERFFAFILQELHFTLALVMRIKNLCIIEDKKYIARKTICAFDEMHFCQISTTSFIHTKPEYTFSSK